MSWRFKPNLEPAIVGVKDEGSIDAVAGIFTRATGPCQAGVTFAVVSSDLLGRGKGCRCHEENASRSLHDEDRVGGRLTELKSRGHRR